jgi:mono/diheme cytochrome c family protein
MRTKDRQNNTSKKQHIEEKEGMVMIRPFSSPSEVRAGARPTRRALSILLVGCFVSGCGSSANDGSQGAPMGDYEIVPAEGSALSGVAGDALRLTVMRRTSGGTLDSLSSGATVTWSGPPVITALAIGSAPDRGILPGAGDTPTAMWLDNPDHYTADQLRGLLWILDRGTVTDPKITVTATISDGSASATATATISVGPSQVGDVARGQTLYAANCASCHGTTGQGSADFPGLNNSPGNVAGDPSWSAALMAMTSRSDMDNLGVSLDTAMPKWLVRPSATGKLLTTQEFADIYAWLATQTQ